MLRSYNHINVIGQKNPASDFTGSGQSYAAS
jgi:hypothetical protein